MSVVEEVRAVHEVVDREVYAPASPRSPFDPKLGLLKFINDYPQEVVEMGMGEAGVRALKLARVANLDHPDLPYILEGVLSEGRSFSITARELLLIAEYAKSQRMQHIPTSLSKLLSLSEGTHNYKLITDNIDDPANNLNYVRFLKTQEERNHARSRKQLQEIDLSGICAKGQENWEVQPSSFLPFVRNGKPYQEEIDKARRLAAQYIDLGCPMMGEKITEKLVAFEEQSKDTYYGFNRVTVTTASVTGAKLHGCHLSMNSYSKTFRVILPPELSEQCRMANKVSRGTPIEFGVRYYPLHAFESVLPQRTKDIIQQLEAFPDANRCPIFDHFRILFFGPNYMGMSVRDFGETAELRTLFNRLDIHQFRLKIFHPILLGEKDAKAYFIDFVE